MKSSLRACEVQPPGQGGIQILATVWSPLVNMQHKFQQFLFMNPGVLQFINRRVDIPAVCRSWYAQRTLCSRPCSGDGCLAPVVVQRQVPWLGRAQKLEFRSLPFLWGCAMLGSTMGTCSASSRVAFGRFFCYFPSDWVDSDPEVNSRRSLRTWPMRNWPCSSSTMAVACVSWFCL